MNEESNIASDHDGGNAVPPVVVRLVLGSAALGLIFLTLIPFLPVPDPARISRWVFFLGRFHPVILHFPIGWIVMASFVEFLRWPPLKKWIPPLPQDFCRLIWVLSAASAVVTVLLGWMLSLEGGYAPQLLRQHMIAGVIAGVGSILVMGQHFLPEIQEGRVRGVTILFTLVALTVAGHLGASISHGENYLTEYTPGPLRALLFPKRLPGLVPPVAHPVFQERILPILTASCLSCHGAGKAKGDLRLDSYEAVMKGGTDGPVIVPGNPDKSEILRRLHLPDDDEDRMPPKGKPAPTPADEATLAAWIKGGARD